MPAALKECAPSVHEVFNNKTSGFRRLVTWVKAQSESAPIDSWLFCGENTGGYSEVTPESWKLAAQSY